MTYFYTTGNLALIRAFIFVAGCDSARNTTPSCISSVGATSITGLCQDAAPNGAGWCAVHFTGANAPAYKYLNPKGLKRNHLYITRHFISFNKKLLGTTKDKFVWFMYFLDAFVKSIWKTYRNHVCLHLHNYN